MSEKSTKPFGYEIVYRDYHGAEHRFGRATRSEATARRAAQMKRCFSSIVSIEPLDEAAYKRVFGWGRM